MISTPMFQGSHNKGDGKGGTQRDTAITIIASITIIGVFSTLLTIWSRKNSVVAGKNATMAGYFGEIVFSTLALYVVNVRGMALEMIFRTILPMYRTGLPAIMGIHIDLEELLGSKEGGPPGPPPLVEGSGSAQFNSIKNGLLYEVGVFAMIGAPLGWLYLRFFCGVEFLVDPIFTRTLCICSDPDNTCFDNGEADVKENADAQQGDSSLSVTETPGGERYPGLPS